MWPKRKILILTPQGAEEGRGFQALLEALKIGTILRQVSVEEPLDLTSLTIQGGETENEDFPDCGPTEIVYWPEIEADDAYRRWGENKGLPQESLAEFLHRIWEQDVILPVAEGALDEGQPLLWKLLSEAGYEPSLLWFGEEHRWCAVQGRGLHWVVSEEWLNALVKERLIGKQVKSWVPEGYWVIRDANVDFYAEREKFRYIGTLLRYPKPEVEENIYHSILLGLQLGVSWQVVKKNIRWNVSGDEPDRRTNRAECIAEDPEYVADRRTG